MRHFPIFKDNLKIIDEKYEKKRERIHKKFKQKTRNF